MSAQLEPRCSMRRMQRSDVAAVLDIEGLSYDFPWSAGIFLDCLRMGYSSWVCEDRQASLLGYTLLSFAVDEGHILNLTVNPAYRRQGIGLTLLDFLVSVAGRAGLSRLILEVRPSNQAGLALYQRNGFEQIGMRRGYYPAHGGSEDAIVLARTL